MSESSYALRCGFVLGAIAVVSTWVATEPSSSLAYSVIGWVSCLLLWLGSLLLLIRGGS